MLFAHGRRRIMPTNPTKAYLASANRQLLDSQSAILRSTEALHVSGKLIQESWDAVFFARPLGLSAVLPLAVARGQTRRVLTGVRSGAP
jgi:hypothetical protein